MRSDVPPTPSVTTFLVVADLCPQLLCRVLGLFAQQDLLLRCVQARTTANTQRVLIAVDGIDRDSAAIIGEKLRKPVPVRRVMTRCNPPGT